MGKTRDLSFEAQLQPLFNSNTGHHHLAIGVHKCQLYEKLEPSARAPCEMSKKSLLCG